MISPWEMREPEGASAYREAAAIFRLARSRGSGLTTMDTLIAAIAPELGATVFTLDQDFMRIARLRGLPPGFAGLLTHRKVGKESGKK